MHNRERTVRRVDEMLQKTFATPEAKLELAIARLWRHWPELLGTDIAALIRPLGHRDTTLVLGATNSMIMQEFRFFSQTILDKANEFLGTGYFTDMHIELMSGRPALDTLELTPIPPVPKTPCPDPLGNLLPCMDASSPVTRCYHAYVRHFRPDLIDKEK